MLRRHLLAAALVAVAGPALAQAQKMRVGVEGNYPPFSQISPDGKLSGFDIDIANAVCEKMKAECTLVQQEFDGIIPALNARKFDMIVASMTITDERKKAVDFSDPYYDVPSRWVAKKGAFKGEATPDALKGKTIIVLRNSPRARWLAERYKESTILPVNKETDVYLELAAGRGDIGFGSSVVSSESFLKRDAGRDFETVGKTVRLEAGSGGVGIAVRKADTELKDKVNAALKAIKADGTYKRLQDKYFDFDISGES
ncbi:MAG TPA: transporter substrate-binding domain-containing protein [Salinarimonas sp.]|jgi:polar amino acid transport system substrate-binding protein/arginine/ornithine transport system substrate-binding protein|nr:transporter substrate-binding domain-containing protein [Salinarimonas sp.]